MGCDGGGRAGGPRHPISIHAPTWGATLNSDSNVDGSVKFQSTHPRGVRLGAIFQGWSDPNFNPRTHVGCDGQLMKGFASTGEFQSTHPRGVRPGCTPRPLRPCYFNPRTHVGCDQKVSDPSIIQIISIHAPTWGATSMPMSMCRARMISIHAPTWGATLNEMRELAFDEFQSTHPRGVRLEINGNNRKQPNFNPRTHVGCDASGQEDGKKKE